MRSDQQATNPVKQLAYSVKQIVKLTSLSKNFVHQQITEQKLKSFLAGRRRLVLHKSLEDWFDELSQSK